MTENEFPCLEHPDGRRFPLGRRLATLGSDPDCQIRLDDPLVRPQHAFLVFQMGSWRIRRLESAATLAVDGKNVRDEIRLAHGAVVGVGRIELAFLERAPEPSSTVSVVPGGDPLAALLASFAGILRETDHARVLADMAQASARLLGSDAVRILYRSEGEGLWRTLAACPTGAPSSRFSGSALRQAEVAGSSVLLGENDLEHLPGGESVQLNGIRSILCAPLALPDGGEGFLYADRLAGHPPFSPADRDLFDALSRVYSEIAAQASRRDHQRKAIEDLQVDAARRRGRPPSCTKAR
jgi:GAF domain-containing protein